MAERQQGLQAFLDVLVKQIDLSSSIVIQRFLDPDRHSINYSGSNEFSLKKAKRRKSFRIGVATRLDVHSFDEQHVSKHRRIRRFRFVEKGERRKKTRANSSEIFQVGETTKRIF